MPAGKAGGLETKMVRQNGQRVNHTAERIRRIRSDYEFLHHIPAVRVSQEPEPLLMSLDDAAIYLDPLTEDELIEATDRGELKYLDLGERLTTLRWIEEYLDTLASRERLVRRVEQKRAEVAGRM